MAQSPQLIALDWGSSSLRAFLMDGQGAVLQERSSADGASRIEGGAPAFEQALRRLAGDWLDTWPGVPVVAAGMVGSQHGWREAPYAACPLVLDDLYRHAAIAQGSGGLRVHILPGLSYAPTPDVADVMRGEETQVAGLLADHPQLARGCRVVMPGTHSKWVAVREGRVEGFATWMTGELFAVMREHSVLGRLMPAAGGFDAGGFDEGVRCSRDDGGRALAQRLFSVRARGLLGQLPAAALADYLSGLLVGHELANALADVPDDEPLALVGEPALCERYARALQAFGRAPAVVAGNTVVRGLWQQAMKALEWFPATRRPGAAP